ncbi:MAG: methylaspartate mutase accessory protein GlmL [Chloroflexota bacterium]
MGNIRLLIDFGSTFTKVVAVDSGKGEILSRSQVPSTVEEDITIGLKQALEKIDAAAHTGPELEKEALACSSAGGGLRVVSIGFVPELTVEAATRAALGAGARIVGCYSYELTGQELTEIGEISPDIILLAGGTDGGDKRVITHNARMLSQLDLKRVHLVVAGNKTAYDGIREIFNTGIKNVRFTKNVMPEIGRLETEHCNREIRDIFIRNIIEAKGIARARAIVKDIIMPTPSAVLAAAELLAEGYGDEEGLGEVIVVDVGGATTDVYSIAAGSPAHGDVIVMGLPEPYVKRTVEGDLGVRHNITTLVEQLNLRGRLPDNSYAEAIEGLSAVGRLPQTAEQYSVDTMLAAVAVEVAMERHAGKVEIVYGPMGEMAVQRGKDLTEVRHVVGTGGPIVFSRDPRAILEAVLFRETSPHILRPRSPRFYVDTEYILYAAGLLAQTEPKAALALMKGYLTEV